MTMSNTFQDVNGLDSIPRHWRIARFVDIFDDVTSKQKKVLASDYTPAGPLPVIDQGASTISGYTDETEKVCAAELPLIVFGDHTRALKYIDFPMALGADGTKCLVPDRGSDAKYLYHFLRTVELPDTGYNRHFKWLKQVVVPLPPLEEQKPIAAILDKADRLRSLREQAITKLDELAQSIFLEMFGDPVTNPKGWDTAHLKDLVDTSRPITYGIVQPGPDVKDGVPYIRVVDLKRGRVTVNTLRRTAHSIANKYARSSVRTGDVLISIRGHVGRAAIVDDHAAGANLTQDTARLSPGPRLLPAYLFGVMSSPWVGRDLQMHLKGGAVKGINLGDLREYSVPVPPMVEQARYAQAIQSLEKSLQLGELAIESGADLFAALAKRAFKGDLSA